MSTFRETLNGQGKQNMNGNNDRINAPTMPTNSTNNAAPATNNAAVNRLDPETHAGLQGMAKKAEHPMDPNQHRLITSFVNQYSHMDRLTNDNKKLKEENEQRSKAYQDRLAEQEKKMVSVERDRDNWKVKADQFKKSLDKSKMENMEQQSIMQVVKRERDKLKLDMIEYTKQLSNRDAKQKELDTKLNKARKTQEDLSQDLRVCESSKRQLSEKLAISERSMREEEASKATLLLQFNTLKSEKKLLEGKVEAQRAEQTRIIAEKEELQKEITALQKKVKEYEEMVDKIVEEEFSSRLNPTLMNQLVSDRAASESRKGGANGEGGKIAAPLTLPFPLAVLREGLHGNLRKRKDDVAETGVAGTSTSNITTPGDPGIANNKKIKVGGKDEEDTEEEGEIIDQQPQPQQGKSNVSSGAATSADAHKNGNGTGAGNNRPREASNKTALIKSLLSKFSESNAKGGKGKR